MKYLIVLSVVVLAACAGQKRSTDVYECADGTLKYCYPGTVATGCEFQDTLNLNVPREFCQ